MDKELKDARYGLPPTLRTGRVKHDELRPALEVLEGGIPSPHRIEHAEPFRPAVGKIYATEDKFDVPREVLIALEKLRIGLPRSLAKSEKRGSEFGVVVGHDFVPHTHHLGVSCWNPNAFGPRKKEKYASRRAKPRLLAGAGITSVCVVCGSQRLANAATTARPACSSDGTV
jgi:hypothetical protein